METIGSVDDPDTVARLLELMRAHLPIPVSPTPELVRTLRRGGLKISAGSLAVKRVFYMGDPGGISCDVTPDDGAVREAIVVSLTHLRVALAHPLYRQIRAYQRERVRRIRASERARNLPWMG